MVLIPGRRFISGLAIALMATLPALTAPVLGGGSGLPLPRFVSLHATKVNVRTGPGVRYPVDWVFVRRGLPVQVVAEFENWRKVRDWQGTEGWVHQSMLSGRRTVVVTGEIRELRRKALDGAAVVARAEPGVIGRLLEQSGDWCRVEISGFKGWLRRDEVFGLDGGETTP
jgi:SH3-like domain-containing protein